MDTTHVSATYRIWGPDNSAYGPVELPVLIDWIKQQRVTGTTWIYFEPRATWIRAEEAPELQMFFSPAATGQSGASTKADAAEPALELIDPRALRRIKILATLNDSELATFIKFVEVQQFPVFAHVVQVGDHGDAMYMIVSGELRARTLSSDGKETTLATLGVGEYFGEISLLDEGPRSADILTNADSVVLKISSDPFAKMRKEAPELGLHFMFALGRSAAGKIRSLTKRYQDSIQFSRYARMPQQRVS